VDSQVVPASVVILTKNEAAAISRCIASAKAFAEIFVIDSNSTDGTQEIAASHGATVIQFDWDGAYPKKKEWALQNIGSSYVWVMYLDADEIMPEALISECLDALSGELADKYAAFDMELDYIFMGRLLRHGHRVTKRALIRRSKCKWPRPTDLAVANMWEVEGHYQPLIDGQVGRMRSRLIHDDPDPLFDYFARHNRYSDWEAHLRLQDRGEINKSRSARARRYSRVPFKPAAVFFYSYLLRAGMLDGAEGFHYAMAQTFYYWQISAKTHDLSRSSSDAR
jgi:glycosyltransferase involved in cell wall biosynthesis